MKKYNNMKKIIVILLTIGAFLASCSAKQPNKNKEEMVKHLDKTEFLSKIADYEKSPNEWKFVGERPAIVDFYATWCGPCKQLAPIIESLAVKYDGKVDFYKIDVDAQPELATLFGIKSIPTLLVIPKSGTPQIIQGVQSEESLDKLINDFLLK